MLAYSNQAYGGDRMKIGELAKKAGCQVVTIRYYEKEGLLPEPERSDSNYRIYSEADIERLRFIRHCRRHGMKLSEIRELLAFKDNPQADCSWVKGMIAGHIEGVNEQIASLVHLKAHLDNLLHTCPDDHQNGGCGILNTLNNAATCPLCEDARCQLENPPIKSNSE